jgi:hypothetical protein
MDGRDEKYIQYFGWKLEKGRDHLEHLRLRWKDNIINGS